MNLAWPTVLHVEDDMGDKELLEHACKALQVKCNVHWVADGVAAIDYLSGVGAFADRELFPFPALMLLDLKMPRKTGFEVLEWLRQNPVLKWLPTIVFTASDSNKDIQRAFELGANSLIVKPTAYKDLLECVKEINHYWFERNRLPTQ